jgi:hypothetical protein
MVSDLEMIVSQGGTNNILGSSPRIKKNGKDIDDDTVIKFMPDSNSQQVRSRILKKGQSQAYF